MTISKSFKPISLILIFILSACTLQTPVPTAQIATSTAPLDMLAGTSWALVSYGNQGSEIPLVADSQVTLQFGAQGGVSGNAGCNSFGGTYQATAGSIQFSEIISTLMACLSENVMQQEHDFLGALNQAASYEISNGNLQIRNANNQYFLNFVPFTEQTTATPVVIMGTDTPVATAVTTATSEPTATTTSSGNTQPDYLDDRSTATGLINSYFNAINRHEYLRAYSYWRNPAASNGTFDHFQSGYETTTHVEITFGQIGGDAGAGQMYYSVPVILTAQTNDGNTQDYAACYILHLSQPTFQEPPFQGLSIDQGMAVAIASGANISDQLANACSGQGLPVGNPINPAPQTNTSDISNANYLDDRSDPILVLSSLFNAINRHEFARAYGYWKDPSASPDTPSYTDFSNGYADTNSVTFLAGEYTVDAGAGNYYYSVPVVISSQLNDGTQQTFAGCYVLHMSNASIQATPPFSPLAIRSANITAIPSPADPASVMPSNCMP